MALVKRYLALPNITLGNKSSFFSPLPLSVRYDDEGHFGVKLKIWRIKQIHTRCHSERNEESMLSVRRYLALLDMTMKDILE